MIKVPARHKFSRKTSIPFKPQDPNCLRKNSRNRTSILTNGQTLKQNSILEIEEKRLSNCTSKNTIIHDKISNSSRSYSTNFGQNCKLRNTLSIRASQQYPDDDKNSLNEKKKISKIESVVDLSRIKLSENADKNTEKNMKQSFTSNKKENIRESAIKKIGNRLQQSSIPFLRSSKMRKASIFHHINNLSIEHESEHYEEFLKETNLDDLANETICEKVTENNSSKESSENLEKSWKKKYQLIEEEVSSKSSKAQFLLNQKKKKKISTNLIKKNSSKDRNASQIELKISKDDLPTEKEIFHSKTQTKIQEQIQNKQISKGKLSQSSEKDKNCENKVLSKQNELKKAEQLRIQQQKNYKQQTEELFRKLEREIASKEEIEKFSKKSANYYQQLRLRLIKKYDQISKDYRLDETQKDKIGLLIEGCNLERHRKVNNFYFEKKKINSQNRADAKAIDQANKDINKLNFVNKQRNKTIMITQTSRPKVKSRRRGKVFKSFNMLSDFYTIMTGESTERDLNNKTHKTFSRFSESETECVFNLTNSDLKSRQKLRHTTIDRPQACQLREGNRSKDSYLLNRKKNFMKREKTEFSSKFDTLLEICQEENDEHEETKKKMKVFEYYCSKIDNGFEKLSQRIKDYVSNL